MATTEQRTGFRLPWAAEPRIEAAVDEPAPSPAANVPAEASAATAVEATTEASTDPGAEAPTQDHAAGPVTSRRANPLVAGLVRAMRDASQTARDESLARFAETAKARVEGIHAESADATAAIRRQSDADIAGIRDWSKAEMARIREETEERIAARRRRLEQEVDEHAARLEHHIELVQAAVATFEAEMEGFFKALLAEEDPARLAGFAEQLPEPPTLEDNGQLDDWSPARTLDSSNAAAAEADFLADLGDTSTEAAASGATETIAVGDLDVVERLATFTDPATDRDPATSTRISVVGLVSVARIAGFKRAIGRAPGVSGVSVASGPNGDFVFTVRHAASADLRTLIPDLDGYAATITNDADGVLSVSASEPGETS